MSKSNYQHTSQSGSFHSSSKKSCLDSEMISPNGLRPNGMNGCNPSDTNNNLNNKHNSYHQKRGNTFSIGSDSVSSKRKKINLPNEKSGKYEGECSTAKVPQHNHYNILEKLKELYKELNGDKSCKELNLSRSSFLLDKLVTREKLHTLIINLYPGNKGYSLAFRPPTSTSSSTVTLSTNHKHHLTGENLQETPSFLYDNSYLLDALDSEELPALIIDFCNVHCPHLYYNGNVIAQIRDYRQSYPLDICDIHYVLLKPTVTALWDHINSVVDNSWAIKDRTALESQLALATAPPICLDPSPLIGIKAINALTERAPLAVESVRKNAKRFLQVTKNRNNKLEKKTHYHYTSLATHLANERRGLKREALGSIKAPELRTPHVEDTRDATLKFIPPVATPRGYDWQPKNTERLTFETDRDNTSYRVRVDLFERATSCEVTGQLTLERQKPGQNDRARMCPFKLSSPLAARRYVKEFMGIFTEEGRKFVKITHERETRVGREIMEMTTGEKIQATAPKIQTMPTAVLTPSTSITSPPPPALIATAPMKLVPPQRLIATTRPPQQCIVLAQVKQESSGNQAIKNLLNQPRAPMRATTVNGGHPPNEVQIPIYLQLDQSNNIVTNIQFQQLIATQVQPMQSHQGSTQDKRNREM